LRLFVALWPPAEVVEHLQAAVADVAGREGVPSGVRWVTAQQLHLTVAFLGEVDSLRQSRAEERFARVCARYPPMTLWLAGAGRFGDRILFVKVAGDRGPLERLATSVAAAGRRAGLDLQERRWRAHITVARARQNDGGLRELARAFDAYCSDRWTASELHLVHSRLGAGENRRSAYETVARWSLTGRPS
jgi:RNA 2',3'-cyclic 3'-phosphodiesterase